MNKKGITFGLLTLGVVSLIANTTLLVLNIVTEQFGVAVISAIGIIASVSIIKNSRYLP